MYAGKTKTGIFHPTRPEKYIGSAPYVQYRSSWEESVLKFCDNNPNVLRWSYEDIEIPYLKPLPNGNLKRAMYIPDVFVEYVNRGGQVVREILEIKPNKQTRRSRSRNVTKKMNENYTYAVNVAKWAAAEKWCNARGIKFKIVTELSIFGA